MQKPHDLDCVVFSLLKTSLIFIIALKNPLIYG